MGKTVAIIAGGEVKEYSTLVPLLKNATVYCADGGYYHCQKLGITPAFLIGDFDSLTTIPKGIPTVKLSADKDYTDSVHAAMKAKELCPEKFLLIGMLGGRTDHSLSNLALGMSLAEEGYSCEITDGLTFLYPLHCKEGETCRATFPVRENYYFSLLSYSDQTKDVTITGGKYPLQHYTLTNRDARAISNEYTGVPVTITFSSGNLYFITTPKD